RSQRPTALSRHGAGRRTILWAAGTGCETATAGGSACTSRRCLRNLAWPKSPMIRAITRCGRSSRQPRGGESAMPAIKVVRYRTKPECADENEELIRDVFAELAESQPDGLRYASFRLDDGVSFVHVAVIDGEHNPLTESAAFGKFQAGIADRCAAGPAAADATPVGSYRLPI